MSLKLLEILVFVKKNDAKQNLDMHQKLQSSRAFNFLQFASLETEWFSISLIKLISQGSFSMQAKSN